MGLLQKITLLMMLFFSEISIICLENVSELVSSLSEPQAKLPVIQAATVQETDVPDDADATLKDNLPTITPAAPVITNPAVQPSTPLPEVAPVVPKVVAPTAPFAEPKVVVPVVSPVVPKIMPTVSVSPVQPENVAPMISPVVAPKIITAAPPVVSKSVSSPIQVIDVQDDEQTGLDTLNVDSSGNWLEKRIWYQKAEQLFEVIRSNLQKAADLRMKFVHEVNQVGHKIDDFYENMSFEKGQIDEMLAFVLQDLTNQEQVRGGDLSSSERSVKLKVQSEQKHFEVLSNDLKLIDDLDEQIDKTMMKAFKEIDTCRGLETRSWNNFKEIGQELDDKKARVLYYEMENFHKNIEQKMMYLQNNLLPYLQNQLVSKVNETMNQIKTAIQTFDSKGLNLTMILKKDEHGDLLILKQRDDMQEKEMQKNFQAKMAAEAKAKSEEPSWLCRMWCATMSFIQPIVDKLHEWICVAICFIQSIFCKFHEWICRLFGY